MKKIVSFFFIVLFINSCSIFQLTSNPMEIIIKGESFTLSWIDDSLKITNNPYKSEKYRVYYRTHGSYIWLLLTEINSDGDPELTIYNSDINYGIYDLGVSSMDSTGTESEIHSSLDLTADPFCGWYINWIGSK